MEKNEDGKYLAPKVKVIEVRPTDTILQGSYTNSIEKSGEEDEIGW